MYFEQYFNQMIKMLRSLNDTVSETVSRKRNHINDYSIKLNCIHLSKPACSLRE